MEVVEEGDVILDDIHGEGCMNVFVSSKKS